MSLIVPVITENGLAALFNASSTGLDCKISHIGLGDMTYTPTADMTALVNQLQFVPIAGGEKITTNEIRVSAEITGDLEYFVKEVGFFLDNGTLFAVWSDDQPYSVNIIPANKGVIVVNEFGEDVLQGTYVIECIGIGPNSFSVTDPNGTFLGNFIAAFTHTQINFTLGGGTVNWVVGEQANINVYLDRILTHKTVGGKIIIDFNLLLASLATPESLTIVVGETNLNLAFYESSLIQLTTVVIQGQLVTLKNSLDNMDMQKQITALQEYIT